MGVSLSSTSHNYRHNQRGRAFTDIRKDTHAWSLLKVVGPARPLQPHEQRKTRARTPVRKSRMQQEPVLLEANVNIGNERNFYRCLSKSKLHLIASKVYVNPFRDHSLCIRPNVVYTSINLRKMKFIPKLSLMIH